MVDNKLILINYIYYLLALQLSGNTAHTGTAAYNGNTAPTGTAA